MRSRRRQPLAVQLADRLNDHRIGLGVLVAIVTLTAGVISVMAINGLPLSDPYELKAVVPADSPIVRPGDDVRVAGQRVGQVRGVEIADEGRVVDMDIEDGSVGEGAAVVVRQRGLAGAVFIQLDRGDADAEKPSGTTIPISHSRTETQLTDVVAAFDQDARASLSRAVITYGGGWVGRGEELNGLLADLPPLLDHGTAQLQALTPEPGEMTELLRGLRLTARGFAGNGDDDLAGLITGARATFEATATESGAIGAALDAAPGAFAEAQETLPVGTPLLRDLRETAVALRPGVRSLDRALPGVNELLGRGDQVATLSRLAQPADRTVRVAGRVLRHTLVSAETIGPLASALVPLASYVAQYPEDVFAGPHGFTTWGRFAYDEGQAPGARAVRFTPILTCAGGRNPYPAPGAAGQDRAPCDQ